MIDNGGYSLFRIGSTKYPLVGEPLMERFFDMDASKMIA